MIWRCSISQFISQMLVKSIPRQALGNLLKGHKTMENISQTRLKPRLGQDLKRIAVLFICHGNICRSTMAHFLFQDMVNKAHLDSHFYIDSAATSREEIGNPPHHGTVNKLREVGIPVLPHKAV